MTLKDKAKVYDDLKKAISVYRPEDTISLAFNNWVVVLEIIDLKDATE